jgi:putative oxidoreductase
MNLNHPELGIAVTRIALGAVLIAHSAWLKAVVFTLPVTAQYFVSIGLPGVLAYVVFAVEAVAGVALVIGYRSRIAALAVIPVLLGASFVHWTNGWLFTNAGGGWEYPALLAALAVAQAFLGDGAFAIGDRRRTFYGDRYERPDTAA